MNSKRSRNKGITAARASLDGRAAVTTPHSGYHWDKTPRRFFEGWYWKVVMPETGESFALIYSIEDPLGNSSVSGVGAQVMGPDEGYIVQYSRDVSTFWASPAGLALGACFQRAPESSAAAPSLHSVLPAALFDKHVALGYQASATWHQGRLAASPEGSVPGTLASTVDSCSWAFEVKPVYGWGDADKAQKATAGWLAALPVFEPHWQVVMAHGVASGWFEWGGKRYEFRDAPAYAEKNWGGGFPSKWCWIQCNSFDGEAGASVTAVGARRSLLAVPGFEEDVGMIGIHYRGEFIELVPWEGPVTWEVEPWGRWRIQAANAKYEAVTEADTTPDAGTPLRAPTATQGLAPFCRDSFFGRVKLTLWQLDGRGQRSQVPLAQLTSSTAAVEVGGGPWWDTWQATARMQEPFGSLVKLPIDVQAISQWLPRDLRPRGL